MRERMKKKKNMIIGGLLAVVFLMSVGYAAFASNLSITGTANTSSWIIKITNIREKTKTSGVTNKGTSYTDLTANFNCELTLPGDSITYEVTVENQGNIDASLKEVTKSFTNDGYIQVTYSGLYKGQMLYKQGAENSTAVMEVTVTFLDKDYEGTFTDTITSNISLNLNFEQEGNNVDTTKKYLVTYDSAGIDPIENIYLGWNDSVSKAVKAPKKLGYDWSNCYTIINGVGVSITNSMTVGELLQDENAEGFTVYFSWNDKTYEVEYDSQGGAENSSDAFTWNNKVTTKNTIKTGYTLEGWYTEPNGQGMKIGSQTLSKIYQYIYGQGNDDNSKKITLYANWIENSYTLQFNSRQGSEVNSQTFKWTESIKSLPTPTREGYTFDCWRSNGPSRFGFPQGVVITEGMSLSEFANNSDPSTPKTIYAYWIANE